MKKRRIQRRDHHVPELNMASLPDLIFTVLFFFMIVTHMRPVQQKVTALVPQGSMTEKLEHKSAVVYIYIGKPVDNGNAGDEYQIQLNNTLCSVDDIPRLIERQRNAMSVEDQERLTVSLHADRNAPMGMVNDVKKALRKAYALNIHYTAIDQ